LCLRYAGSSRNGLGRGASAEGMSHFSGAWAGAVRCGGVPVGWGGIWVAVASGDYLLQRILLSRIQKNARPRCSSDIQGTEKENSRHDNRNNHSRNHHMEHRPCPLLGEFKVKHMMISKRERQFSGLSGVLTEHATDSTLSYVEAAVPVATISTGDAQRDGHLKSADFFDAEKVPYARLQIHQDRTQGDAYEVTGDLTIHGVTKPVDFRVDGPSAPVKIPGEIPASDFLPPRKSTARTSGWCGTRLETGGFLVGEEASITLDVEFIKAGQ